MSLDSKSSNDSSINESNDVSIKNSENSFGSLDSLNSLNSSMDESIINTADAYNNTLGRKIPQIHNSAFISTPEAETTALELIKTYASENKITKLAELAKMTKGITYDSQCIRNQSNWANPKPEYHFEKDGKTHSIEEIKENVRTNMKYQSPKMVALLAKIRELDKADMEKHGRLFKHFIFSDLKNYHGTKIITTALLAEGFHLGYNILSKETSKGIVRYVSIKNDSELKETEHKNFFLLSSVSLYDEPLRVEMKKNVLKKFNERPTNVYGSLARIIVMDSGFKEGIDLFDIKYVHIFEPQTTMADQKQVIGRGTRTCGQKGLRFNPKSGWTLYVYKYDLEFPEILKHNYGNTKTAFAYYLLSQNMDIRLLNLTAELEHLLILGSVDYDLNYHVHNISENDMSNEVHMMNGGNIDSIIYSSKLGEKHRKMREYIKANFSEYKWDKVKMENLCGYEGPATVKSKSAKSITMTPQRHATNSIGANTTSKIRTQGGAPQLITYSPTQAFISHYFTPTHPLKGMVLWQSVGTGKTCTAIATATHQFEKEGYTILWVTRTTLKNDIWKNMFEQVCHDGIREAIEHGIEVPDKKDARMKMLSKSWSIRPMSYKQFSNLVSKANSFYKSLVKKNGEADPLRKTLLIIDEAHKLYGGGDLSTIERPDMGALHAALMNSYAMSGADSVKLMLMTATPITDSPLEFVKLLNLCKPADMQMPDEIEGFSDMYLNDVGEFTETGKLKFLDDIAGHVSYLNREFDGRQFSRPILKNVLVPVTNPELAHDIKAYDKNNVRRLLESNVLKYKADILENVNKLNGELKYIKPATFKSFSGICDKYENKQKTACKKIVRGYVKDIVSETKEQVKEIKEHIQTVKNGIKHDKLFSKESLAKIKDTLKTLTPEEQKKLHKYKKSAYYTLKTKCVTPWKTQTEFNKLVDSHPIMHVVDNYDKSISAEVDAIRLEFNAKEHAMENKIKELAKISKKIDMNDLEESTMKMIIHEHKKALLEVKGEHNASMKKVGIAAKTSRRKLTLKKKALKKMIETQLKKEMKVAKEEENEIKNAEKKLKQQMIKEKTYVEKLPGNVEEIMQKHKNDLNNQIEIDMKLYEAETQRILAEKAEKKRVQQEKLEAKEKAQKEKLEAKEKAQKEKLEAKEKVRLEKAEKAEQKEKDKQEKLAAKMSAKK